MKNRAVAFQRPPELSEELRLAEFVPAGTNQIGIIFGQNSFLTENTAITASVEVYGRGAQR